MLIQQRSKQRRKERTLLLQYQRKQNKIFVVLLVFSVSFLLPLKSQARLLDDEKAIIDVFEKVSPSVVFIKNAALQLDWFSSYIYEIPQGAGSGFIWDDQGHVVTNFHVIYQADRIEVILPDQVAYKAKVAGVSPDHDLAVLCQ